MVTLNQEQNNITINVVVTWSNPYSKINNWDQSQYEREADNCAERLRLHAHWDLEEEEEEKFLQKITSGCYPEDCSEKEQKIFFDIEEGNTNGGQIGNYGLCVKKAREVWRRKLVINDDFFMPFHVAEEEIKAKAKEEKIYIVMYHEHVDYESHLSSIECVFKTEEQAAHWIAAQEKKVRQQKRHTKEFIRKGGDEYNLPYEKKFNRYSWQDIWYTIEEKVINKF